MDDEIRVDYAVQYREEWEAHQRRGTYKRTFEEWLIDRLFEERLHNNINTQFYKDADPVYLAFQPPVTRVLVRFVVDAVDWVREAGFKVRGRLGLYKPPF